VDSSVESSEVDGFTATGIDFCCLVRVLRTGFGFSCGISCSLINPTGKGKIRHQNQRCYGTERRQSPSEASFL
jgi:hypothetical protein